MARARRGDRVAFQDLVRPHMNSVRRFAFSFSGSWNDADDLAQEVLIKAYRSIGSFEGRSTLSTWLYTLARSVFIDSRRARAGKEAQRQQELEPDVEDGDAATQEELVAGKEDAERLWRAVRALAPEFRIPLVLFDIEGMSYEEIAAVEHAPIGTIRSRLSRARAKLAALLAPGSDEAHAATEGTLPASLSSNPAGRPAA